MKLDRERQALVDEIYDDAIKANGKDHLAAAVQVQAELVSLEASGHQWASVVLDAAQLDGITKRVKAKAKRSGVSIPNRSGRSKSMPARYSRQRADGGRQMEMWIDLPLGELGDLIQSIRAQGGVLMERAGQMAQGLELAERHGVSTAREGFQAEGIDVAEVAS